MPTGGLMLAICIGSHSHRFKLLRQELDLRCILFRRNANINPNSRAPASNRH